MNPMCGEILRVEHPLINRGPVPQAVPRILYPTVEEIIETNRRVLEVVVDKRDRHVVWDERAIAQAIAASKRLKGVLYDKAAVLLIELVKSHPFKSGNRRTATALVADFLKAKGVFQGQRNGGSGRDPPR